MQILQEIFLKFFCLNFSFYSLILHLCQVEAGKSPVFCLMFLTKSKIEIFMKKAIGTFVPDFPVLARLVSTSVETAIEIKNKKGVLAFFNNAFSFGVVAGELKELAEEAVIFQGVNSSANKAALKAFIKEQFKGEKDAELLEIIFDHVLNLIFMNIGGGFALDRAIREHLEGKSKK